ncbi:Exodeoxyribonuclease III [gamma proteobacterium HdN1]|nr:Exodeoxyribonuclease III [gamma proteobacterium HdN1]
MTASSTTESKNQPDSKHAPLLIVSANTNGIRSAASKGFLEWIQKRQPDVVCIQETKAQLHQLDVFITDIPGYHSYFFDAQKKGYSGVAVYCKREPDRVVRGLGFPIADDEGRYLQVDFGDLSVASLYLPSGSASDEAQEKKYRFLDTFLPMMKAWREDGRRYILCGDWNIAHKNIDIKNWRSNQKNSGFLPEERAWLDRVFDEQGWVDAFRAVNSEADQYTWWSNRGQAWAKNVGWRIDYQIVSPELRDTISSTEIYKDERFSDHAPLLMSYDITLG